MPRASKEKLVGIKKYDDTHYWKSQVRLSRIKKCGCKVNIPVFFAGKSNKKEDWEKPLIERCPLHAAAPELLEAAKATLKLVGYLVKTSNLKFPPEYLTDNLRLKEAIKKAEGGK